MEIIREGNIQKLIAKYRFECRACGCVFECGDGEVEKRPGEYNCTDIYCGCPTCKKSVLGKRVLYREQRRSRLADCGYE